MSKRKIGIAVVALILLIGGAIWVTHRARANAQVEKLQQLEDKLVTGATPQQEQAEQYVKGMKQLSPDQTEKVLGHMMEIVLGQMQKHVDEYFALPPEKRNDYLDKQLLDQEKAQKEMEKRSKEKGPASKNFAFGGPGGPNPSPEALSQARNQMLDNISPEMRAKLTAFMSDVQKRRIALGLPAAGSGMMIMQGPGVTIKVGP